MGSVVLPQRPTVGFGDWNRDFPNPWDFMNLFAGNAGSSLNYGYVNDPHYNSEINKLSQQPPGNVSVRPWVDMFACSTGHWAQTSVSVYVPQSTIVAAPQLDYVMPTKTTSVNGWLITAGVWSTLMLPSIRRLLGQDNRSWRRFPKIRER